MRPLLALNLALVAAVVWLGCAVYQQRAARDAYEAEVTVRTKQVAELRAKAAARHAAAATGTARALSQQTGGSDGHMAAATVTDPNDAQVVARRLAAIISKRRDRLNALHGYMKGFTALHVPPEKIAQAKEIILAGWNTSDVPRGTRSMDELMAEHEATLHYLDQQLTALLGADTYEHLKAYEYEEHYAWTIGTDMWDGGAPLSDEQLHALTLAIVQTQYQDRTYTITPQLNQIPDPTTGLGPQDIALLAATAASLSPAQQTILRQNLIDENRYNAAMRSFGEKQRQLWKNAP